MGCQHKLNNPHMHFRSLVHTLAGLNENLRPSVQFQELLCLIYLILAPVPTPEHLRQIHKARTKWSTY